MRPVHYHSLAVVLLGAVTLAAFCQTYQNDFVNLDDPQYVTGNRHVQSGFNLESFVWAWTDFSYGMYNPLTRLSFILNHECFGLNAAGYHLTNLLLHLANVLLIYSLLYRLTGSCLRSLLLAAFFAVHPLRVESVAWVTERKDVLSTLFGLLAIHAYVNFTRNPSTKRYALIALAMTLSLLAKPTLVTLPCLLLLLDYWPLRRFDSFRLDDLRSLVWEKLPLFGLSLFFGVMTVVVHVDMGAGRSLESVPVLYRVGNGILACGQYLAMTAWPAGLAIHYPHLKDTLPWIQVAGVGALLVAVTILAIRLVRKCPYLLVGWLWYLGTLAPVLGIVRFNGCAWADRYTYLPHIGLFVAVLWALADVLARWKRSYLVWAPAVAVGLVACVIVTQQQVGQWRNSVTLWSHALAVTQNNAMAHNNLGSALVQHGQLEEAYHHYVQALNIRPSFADVHSNLGAYYTIRSQPAKAKEHYAKAIRIRPDHPGIHCNLGKLLMDEGSHREAEQHYRTALQLSNEQPDAHLNLGVLLQCRGMLDLAEEHFAAALHLRPNDVMAHVNLGLVLAQQGKAQQAEKHLVEALRLDPSRPVTHMNLGIVLSAQSRITEAQDRFNAALQLDPKMAEAHFNLAVLLLQTGHGGKAEHHFTQAQQIDPTYVAAYQRFRKHYDAQQKRLAGSRAGKQVSYADQR